MDDLARVAGRGAIYITAAKVWFIVSGYAIHFVLSRLISPEQYGLYLVVTYGVSIVNAVVVTGTYQAVSKYISQGDRNADSVKATALRLQALLGGGISLGFFLIAPIVAQYLNDPRLTPYFRLASLITLSYSFYAVYTGYFNGQRRFLAQAGLDASYSSMKLGLIVLLVWLGYGVGGAIAGFALAAGGVLALSVLAAGRGKPEGRVGAGELLKFQNYLLAFTLTINLLQKVDLMLIKALSSPEAEVASENVGYYGAAVNIANITYQVIVSITFVIFPLVSQSTFSNNHARTRTYVARTLRYTVMMMALTATLFSANASQVLRIVYPQDSARDYQRGSVALSIVAFGMLFFGLLYVLTTIISASGRPRVSLLIGALTLVASAALNAVLIPRYGLTGAAIGTTVAMLAGALVSGAYVLGSYSALLSPVSAIRIAGCGALVYIGSRLFSPTSVLLTLVELGAMSLLYLAALIITRELGKDDLIVAKRVVG